MMSTAQVAEQFGCSRETVTKLANRIGVGMNLGGRAGFRFDDDDLARMREALRPRPVERRRRSA